MAGLVLVPGITALAMGGEQTHLTSNTGLVIVSGVSKRLANGCTSGHGVCGTCRLSLRGIVTILIYIGPGAATSAALRGIVGVCDARGCQNYRRRPVWHRAYTFGHDRHGQGAGIP
jgi:uncharacterized membrane protein YedE/YeeE